MGRRNDIKQLTDYTNLVKKSNELSMAELNYGLSLNQMQLLAFAIYSTQQNGKTEFKKHEFQEKFMIEQYRTEDAYKDSAVIMGLKVSIKDLERDYFRFTNIFGEMIYNKGLFQFEWNSKIIPHILELKEKYVITDLKVASYFKSRFSWRLYEYLKAHYGYWLIKLSKNEIMLLFSVENRKTYQKSTAQFKRGVLDIAIKEINELTELEVRYEEEKKGNKIVNFIIHWSSGIQKSKATENQIHLIREIHSEVENKIFEYLSLVEIKDLEEARKNIMRIKEINSCINEDLTSEKGKELVWESKVLYKKLQTLLTSNGEEPVYYNWLDD